jgi:O-antigen ligase
MKNKLLLLIKIFFACLFIFPFFKESISSFFLIMLCFFTLLNLIINKEKIGFSKKVGIYTIPFFIVLMTNVFAVNSSFDFNSVGKAFLFFAFPVVFYNLPFEFFKKLENNYLYIFKYTCLLICMFYVFSFLSNYPFLDFFTETNNESVFRKFVYKEILFFKIHPTYFSVFLLFCVAHSIVEFNKEKKWLNIFLFLFFSIMILLLSSKIVILLNIITSIYLFISIGNIKKRYVLFGSVLFFFLGILILPGIKSRFVESIKDFNNPPVGKYYNSTNIRKSIIDCSTTILKENYIRGVGFSNIQNELNLCYESKYNSDFYKQQDYLTHNYFFYIFLGSGIVGFLFFLFYLITLIKDCFAINNKVLNVFVFSCIVLMFFEDFLYRHYGCYFFNLIIMSYFMRYEILKNNT